MKKIFDKKENLGITLIALVVTIIILLILAGVTIGFAMNGTGLFDKSKLATDEYNNSVDRENYELNNLEQKIDVNSRETVTISQEEYNRLLTSSNANNYSTEETIVGTWIDGKTLYQKTIDCGAFPAGAVDSYVMYEFTGMNIDHVHTLFAYDTGYGGNIPYVHPKDTPEIGIRVNSSNVMLWTGSDRTSFGHLVITIQYTKTTD